MNYYEDEKIVKRFFDKVDKKSDEECWEWIGYTDKDNYGRLKINKKMFSAHRISFEIANKRFIKEKMFILHSCDNPKCVNPNHLSEGTNQDNMTDMKNKERQARGEGNGRAKLTKEQVLKIREKYDNNVTRQELAKEYNISWTQINRIINKQLWSHI